MNGIIFRKTTKKSRPIWPVTILQVYLVAVCVPLMVAITQLRWPVAWETISTTQSHDFPGEPEIFHNISDSVAASPRLPQNYEWRTSLKWVTACDSQAAFDVCQLVCHFAMIAGFRKKRVALLIGKTEPRAWKLANKWFGGPEKYDEIRKQNQKVRRMFD